MGDIQRWPMIISKSLHNSRVKTIYENHAQVTHFKNELN